MTDKLKPCPFCGGTPEILSNLTHVWIECMTCHARKDPAQSRDVAISNWNYRLNPAKTTISFKPVSHCERCLSDNVIYKIFITLKDEVKIKAFCLECGWDKFLSHLENLAQRQNSALAKWREHVVERDGAKCVICGSSVRLEAHHIIPVSCDTDRKYMYSLSNGITLCHECHKMVHKNVRNHYAEVKDG